jgi:tetratricopeptide (TPR) repeat protein
MVILLMLGSAYAQNTKATAVRDDLLRAEQELKSGNIEAAAKDFRSVLDFDPRNVEAHVNLGVIGMMDGDFRSASHDFRQALEVQPSQMKAEALLGICSRRLREPSAKGLLQKSFGKLTDVKLRTQVGMELVGLYESEGDAEHAVTTLQKLVEINPDDVEILFAAQRVYRELADDTLNKLAVVAPGSARMQQVIAQRLVNAGDVRNAIDHYKRALEINPRLPGLHFELAQAILESDSNDPATQAAAQKELETAIAADGDSPSTQCRLGRIALLRSDVESAHTHYARAVELNPRDPESQLGLGTALMMSGKLEDAKKYLELAVLSDPLNDAAHYRLARVYRDLQLTEKAQREVKLSEEIRNTKEQVAALYRQMNQKPAFERDEIPDNAPTDRKN